MKKIGDNDFELEVVKSELPVLVDFSAPWCGPCKAMEPVLDAVAETYEGRLKVVKVDVSEAPGVATQFMVHSVPTFLFLKQGQVVGQLVGAVGRAKLEGTIATLIS